MSTWEELLASERRCCGDKSEILHVAPDDAVLTTEFDSGYGTSEGPPFTVWTESRVYFPIVYDGAEWVGSAPRWPEFNEATTHMGGQ